MKQNKSRLILLFSICVLVFTPLNLIWHEVVGHGLSGILAGGRIAELNLFGFQVFPKFEWSGVPGSMDVQDVPTSALYDLTVLAGPEHLVRSCISSRFALVAAMERAGQNDSDMFKLVVV